jgi:RimJ/RimL family protein N-acetyltransferase
LEGTIRKLEPRDIAAILALASAAGWNQTAADIEMLLRLAPDGCFGIECDGVVAATTSLLPIAPREAWLGMVLTGDAFRRRGFARRLVEHALEAANSMHIPTIGLDATDMGRPLYASFGFCDEQPVERWSGRLQKRRTGTDSLPTESPLLRELAARSDVFAEADAYLMTRPGMRAHYIGPFVAPDPAAAESLIRSAFETPRGETYFWDVLPQNVKAVQLLQRLGFERVRSLVRMVRGPALPRADEHTIYAIRGFELG